MAKTKTMDLTKGPVMKTLLIFMFPIWISNLMQQLYNTADMVVVGRFVGDDALAAVGATGDLTVLIINLFFGLSVGANIICANLYGARNKEALDRSMHNAMLVAFICGIVLTFAGLFLSRPMLQLMSCPDKVINQSVLYMQIYFAGAPVSMLYNFGAAILRAHGDTKRPMVILTISGLVNVTLNLVLVIVFHMGVAGVAIATVVSQAVSAVMVLRILFSSKEEYGMQLKKLRIYKSELGTLLRTGIPCGINGAIFSVANVILQSSINSLGELAMAGAAASNKISILIFTALSATYSACISFAGQCYGAKDYKRIHDLWGKSILLCLVITATEAVFLTFFSDTALSLFTTNPDAIAAARPMLIIFAWSYMLYSVPECTVGCIRGMGHSSLSTFLNIFCICVPRLIWNFFFFPMNPTLGWLYVCLPISYVICSVAQVCYYLYLRKKVMISASQAQI